MGTFEKLLKPGKAALQAARNLIEQARPVWLGAFTLDQLVELGGKYLPQMKHYADILQRLDTDRNVMQEEAGVFADEWQKWAARHREESVELTDLMHEATIAGTDPAKSFEELPIMFGARPMKATRENVKQVLLAIREQMRGRAGDPKKEMFARMKEVQSIIPRNKRRAKDHARLQARWAKLSPEARAMYTRARDMYAKRRDQREAALIQRIRDMKMDDRRKAANVARIQMMFESQRVQAPYFPLQRQGDFWISAKSPQGKATYIMREKVGEWEREIAALKAAGFKIKATGRKGERVRMLDGALVPAGFLAHRLGIVATFDAGLRRFQGVRISGGCVLAGEAEQRHVPRFRVFAVLHRGHQLVERGIDGLALGTTRERVRHAPRGQQCGALRAEVQERALPAALGNLVLHVALERPGRQFVRQRPVIAATSLVQRHGVHLEAGRRLAGFCRFLLGTLQQLQPAPVVIHPVSQGVEPPFSL